MKFLDFLCMDALIPNLTATTREAAVREMLEALRQAGALEPHLLDRVADGIAQREESGTTGIGRGLAIPHAPCAEIDELVGCLAVSRIGVDWQALDSEQVFVVVMVLSRPEAPKEHLEVLEAVTRPCQAGDWLDRLKAATDVETIENLLREADDAAS